MLPVAVELLLESLPVAVPVPVVPDVVSVVPDDAVELLLPESVLPGVEKVLLEPLPVPEDVSVAFAVALLDVVPPVVEDVSEAFAVKLPSLPDARPPAVEDVSVPFAVAVPLLSLPAVDVLSAAPLELVPDEAEVDDVVGFAAELESVRLDAVRPAVELDELSPPDEPSVDDG